eukprot:scaffold197359_cov17-Tisochrysis_lutea.AAC.1
MAEGSGPTRTALTTSLAPSVTHSTGLSSGFLQRLGGGLVQKTYGGHKAGACSSTSSTSLTQQLIHTKLMPPGSMAHSVVVSSSSSSSLTCR